MILSLGQRRSIHHVAGPVPEGGFVTNPAGLRLEDAEAILPRITIDASQGSALPTGNTPGDRVHGLGCIPIQESIGIVVEFPALRDLNRYLRNHIEEVISFALRKADEVLFCLIG